MKNKNPSIVLLCAFVFTAFITSCGSSSTRPTPTVNTPPAIPATGTYIGGVLIQDNPTLADFNTATGVQHSAFMEFMRFPEVLEDSSDEQLKILAFIAACKSVNAIPMLTLEMFSGLNSYTDEQLADLVDFLYYLDVSLFLRWNHEMNGSWYPWGQQPTLYIETYRIFADAIHAGAPNVAMAWTPNQGWGYPWAGGAYSISPDSPDYAILDTNGDGVLNESDDPYGPYFPDSAYVDWVGHSFYHWGNGSSRGINEVPYNGKWGNANGIDNAIPNFHEIFAVGYDKPMMIAESSALYDPLNKQGGGASEFDIKSTWIQQVYNLTDDTNPRLDIDFPKIKALFWFSELKYENEVSTEIDWRVHANQEVIDFYNNIVSDPYFIKAE